MRVCSKRALDVMNTECIRLLKLTKDAVVPVSFTIPRKVCIYALVRANVSSLSFPSFFFCCQSKADFAEELFPPSASAEPALTAAAWFGGETRGPLLSSLDPARRKSEQTAAHARKPQAYTGLACKCRAECVVRICGSV